MDALRFDRLAQTLSSGTTRKSFLRQVAGLLFAGLIGVGVPVTAEAGKGTGGRPGGKRHGRNRGRHRHGKHGHHQGKHGHKKRPSPAECQPISDDETCADQCGSVENNCQQLVDCGPCACTPRSCVEAGATCGPVADGCGDLLQCGDCTGTQTCGGGGTPNHCGVGTCVPRTCTVQGIECGLAGDGCGGVIDCQPCPPGQTCGGGGTPNVCGAP